MYLGMKNLRNSPTGSENQDHWSRSFGIFELSSVIDVTHGIRQPSRIRENHFWFLSVTFADFAFDTFEIFEKPHSRERFKSIRMVFPRSLLFPVPKDSIDNRVLCLDRSNDVITFHSERAA